MDTFARTRHANSVSSIYSLSVSRRDTVFIFDAINSGFEIKMPPSQGGSHCVVIF